MTKYINIAVSDSQHKRISSLVERGKARSISDYARTSIVLALDREKEIE